LVELIDLIVKLNAGTAVIYFPCTLVMILTILRFSRHADHRFSERVYEWLVAGALVAAGVSAAATFQYVTSITARNVLAVSCIAVWYVLIPRLIRFNTMYDDLIQDNLSNTLAFWIVYTPVFVGLLFCALANGLVQYLASSQLCHAMFYRSLIYAAISFGLALVICAAVLVMNSIFQQRSRSRL
jgi:hypothetical protein